ncbi:MAG: sigma-70 family RNA polymerase sigma factor [Chloroflexi bacterium]|nr:sigma-70 family RNA polymerase sigma factor [Chloroflexota bacterium]
MPQRDRERRFDALYAEHQHTLFAFLLGRTGDRELALDLLQEVFTRVWRSLDSIEALAPEKRAAWLFSVARNLVIDDYRARASRARTQAALDSPRQWAEAPEDTAVHADQLQLLDRAIADLPEELRVVFVLSAVGQRNSSEISEILGRPPGTVRYQLSEARRRLATQLGVREAVKAS